MKKKVLSPIALALVAIALAGCGGGGGGGGGGGAAFPVATGGTTDTTAGTGNTGGVTQPPVVVAPTQPATDGGNLVTTVGTPSYSSSTEELAAFTLLNAERQRCGFGLLAQNTMLDTAAAGHANYLLRNNMAGHFQNMSDPYSTGANAWDRVVAAGYAPAVILDDNTDTTGGGANNITGRGASSVRGLLSAPYHAVSLLMPELDIGISIKSSDSTGTTGTYGPRAIAQFNIALAQGSYSQKPGGAAVQTYPCDGTVGTAHTLSNESPNPIAGRNLAVNPIGQPIIVAVTPGQMIDVTTATLKIKSSGVAAALLPALTKASDANSMIDVSHLVLMPDLPLSPNTEYEVTIKGTNTTTTFDGTNWHSTGTNPAITDNATGAFTKTFSFTTGS
ncbi:CAP domain-containing protein [Variovorax ginsengisoli]|uniref:SCP domain-containing protein n=1 Tax=Variovorax ginsengisoli TaxID=363844 RepID=A0ABT8SA78_9BURK|nr:CAP domain-containing protein [Variovorax ginsengisoli]MDN8616510.1 hypothetical protein [Variovorax ginsengisoli]MDO1535680.1 hypothetical protein [Variovorax ginsengisoli]